MLLQKDYKPETLNFRGIMGLLNYFFDFSKTKLKYS